MQFSFASAAQAATHASIAIQKRHVADRVKYPSQLDQVHVQGFGGGFLNRKPIKTLMQGGRSTKAMKQFRDDRLDGHTAGSREGERYPPSIHGWMSSKGFADPGMVDPSNLLGSSKRTPEQQSGDRSLEASTLAALQRYMALNQSGVKFPQINAEEAADMLIR